MAWSDLVKHLSSCCMESGFGLEAYGPVRRPPMKSRRETSEPTELYFEVRSSRTVAGLRDVCWYVFVLLMLL